MIINFNRAKKIATSCLAMTSCAFFLWVQQNNIQASDTPLDKAVMQTVTSQQVGGGTETFLIDPD